MDAIFTNIINYLGIYGPILACFLIVIESMIPILPLCVFITINFIVFGSVYGFIISWIFTLIGCNLAYFIIRKFKNKINKRLLKYHNIDKFLNIIGNFSVPNLTLVTAVPFTPAFAINICCALSKMPYKNYLVSMIMGKLVMVYFWGFIGLTFMECLREPIALIKLAILLLIAYFISLIVKKVLKLN